MPNQPRGGIVFAFLDHAVPTQAWDWAIFVGHTSPETTSKGGKENPDWIPVPVRFLQFTLSLAWVMGWRAKDLVPGSRSYSWCWMVMSQGNGNFYRSLDQFPSINGHKITINAIFPSSRLSFKSWGTQWTDKIAGKSSMKSCNCGKSSWTIQKILLFIYWAKSGNIYHKILKEIWLLRPTTQGIKGEINPSTGLTENRVRMNLLASISCFLLCTVFVCVNGKTFRTTPGECGAEKLQKLTAQRREANPKPQKMYRKKLQ